MLVALDVHADPCLGGSGGKHGSGGGTSATVAQGIWWLVMVLAKRAPAKALAAAESTSPPSISDPQSEAALHNDGAGTVCFGIFRGLGVLLISEALKSNEIFSGSFQLWPLHGAGCGKRGSLGSG